jgi:hypothetical protein
VPFGSADVDPHPVSASLHSLPRRYAEPALPARTTNRYAVPDVVFWSSIAVAFLIANLPPPLIVGATSQLLGVVISSPESVDYAADNLTASVVVPMKEALFFICLLILSYPVIRSIADARRLWLDIDFKNTLRSAAFLFVGLAILVLPYSYPRGLNSNVSGLAGLGVSFAQMSAAPFSEADPLVYKRLLKPALAHFLHLHGYIAYYLFSLALAFVLIFLTVVLLDTILAPGTTATREKPVLTPGLRRLLYLSLMTSSFMIVEFQWPGYSDALSFILLLLVLCVPMTAQARLAVVALCALNHETLAVAVAPLIFFAFPPQERYRALIPLALFYALMIGVYALGGLTLFQAQGSVQSEGSVWTTILADTSSYVLGVLFAYKLFWLLFGFFVWLLWRRKSFDLAACVLVITLFPVALTVFAWDTTRVAGFGWIGLAIAFGMFLKESANLPRTWQHAVVVLAAINLLIPTYNVVLFYSDTLSAYPYRGLYMALDSLFRQIPM